MSEDLYLPVTDPAEIDDLLDGFPAVVDRESFVQFVRGFPRNYLSRTPKVEIVKHYLISETLDTSEVISLISPVEDWWKLSLLTRDRTLLFARISGVLSCFGMNILEAEAFANARSLALDTLVFEDREGHFRDSAERQRLQVLLEDVLKNRVCVEKLIEEKWPDISEWETQDLTVSLDNGSHPSLTVMRIRCRDHFGLLYLVSHHLSDMGFSIEIARVRTHHQEADDEFYLLSGGRRLNSEEMAGLEHDFASFRVPRFES